MKTISSKVLNREWEVWDPASMSDWGKTEYKFDCKFSDDLNIFITKTLRRTLIAVHNIMGKKVVL
ncbi:hypothetical protein ACZ11_08390 [Lysinibacillus xylanilyticus]|uniref:Uncharacterized protein n=1 Tax=Lysinibacillus xylanilyticus TaxID=582475 RepID=A0A0K9FD70_9BACI|nr:hypothetical protein ACZ11_08390 [Lysinibacillus xylanilyticus]